MPQLTRRFLLASAGACLAGTAQAANKPPPPAPQPPAAIGAAMPLSGDLSLVGDECLRGAQLAADDINAAGGINGKPVTLITADTIGQAQAATAVNTLINQNHAGLILSGGASELCYPASAAAELAGIPFIELNAPADGITARGFRFLLRTGPTTAMVARLAVSTITARYKGKKIGLLFNTGATSGAIAAAVLTTLAAAKIAPLLAIGYPADITDLHDPVGRLKRAGAEILLHAAGPSDALALFLAMHDQAWRPAAIIGCGDGFLLRENAFALGSAFDGVFVIGAPFYPASAAAIAAAYTAKFGAPPRTPDSLTAYVGARLTLDTFNANGGDPTKLLDAMRKIDIPTGNLANGFGVAFDKSGQNTRSLVTLQQWRHQQLIAVS
jgi:branched-chain amino acid transport system substrate-binding protein